MFSLQDNRRTWIGYALLMVCVSAVTFSHVRALTFWDGWDDRDLMADMRTITRDPALLFSTDRVYEVRPPVDAVFLGGYWLWGANPAGYHVLQAVLHLAASLLAAFVFYRLGADLELSLAGGLLFLVNAAHFRAVHWMVCIEYILALIFGLLVVLCFGRFLEDGDKRRQAGSVLALCGAMLSHPSAASVALFCAYLAWRKTEKVRATVALSWPLLVAAPVLAVIASVISPAHAAEREGVLSALTWSRIPTILLWYPGRLVASAHWVNRAVTGNVPHTWELGLGVLALGGVWWLYKRRIFPAADWGVWAVVSILPFLNNRPDRLIVGPSRQLYFASLGSSLVLAWGVRALAVRMPKRIGRIASAGALALLVILGVRAVKKAEGLAFYLGGRGYALRAADNPDDGRESLRLFQEALSHAPDLVPADVYMRLGTLALRLGEFPPQVFETGLAKNPMAPDLNMLAGVAAFLQENPAAQVAGMHRVQRAYAAAGDKAQFRVDAGLAFFNLAAYFNASGQREKAVALYQQAIAWCPNYPAALNSLGAILYEQGDVAGAVGQFQAALKQQPEFAPALENLANAFYNQNQYADALALYRKIVALAPNNAPAHYHLGQIYERLGHTDAARDAYERAVRADPQQALAWRNLGNLLYQQNDLDAAIAAYQQLVRLAPREVYGLNNLGYLYYRQNRCEEAAACFLRALDVAPDDLQALARLGMTYEKQGRVQDALAAYHRVMAQNAAYPGVRERVAALGQSQDTGSKP